MVKTLSLTTTAADFDLPPWTTNWDGRPRTVGVELEFAGLSAQQAAAVVAHALGGTVEQIDPQDPHAFAVKGTEIGDVSIELDSRYVHPGKSLLKSVGAAIASWAGSAASYLIPCEFVTGPIPIQRLYEIQKVISILREAGARGTQDAPIYAFGMHFNPEVPRLDAETIVSVLKAFLLLNAWLRKQVAPDPTRTLLGFADPFPDLYVRRVVDPEHWPDLPTFLEEYIAANATRNRDLDLLPLLLYLDEAAVRAKLPGEKIGKRPTFHYRMPDARVSDPGWSIAPDWNRWVTVERLAADRLRLDRLGEAYLAFQGEAKSWADLAERLAFT